MEVEPVVTERLEMVSLSPDVLTALLDGRRSEAETAMGLRFPEEWPGELMWLFRLRIEQMHEDPSTQPWLLRAIVLRGSGGMVIGHINFHEPPIDGAVEIGYTIEPAHRRRGYATEAVLGMFRWAEEAQPVQRFIASVSPDNAPSLGLISNLGFVQTGVQWDERDGEELVFELVWPTPT
ncbi:MAG: [ribosomal protein S5]-alanine N-acetyltransferase [Actinomycetota bacterium]|jgi:RimJ/RimL family protein N-acetyltransferase|nr:[ribosomal protein S5]-alanine N-acetyltransferase [Actinomycetota bacterium]